MNSCSSLGARACARVLPTFIQYSIHHYFHLFFSLTRRFLPFLVHVCV